MRTSASSSDQPPDKERRKVFEALVNEHHSRIRRFIRTMGVPSSSVDDIAHEALLVAYHRFSQFEVGTSFTAWVCAIARNLIRGERRKESRRFNILNGAYAEYMEDQAQPEELGDNDGIHHLRLALRECLELIPEDNRQLIHARYVEGLEPTAMAQNLDLSPDSIRMRLMRLRKALRECITKKLGNWM